MRSSWGELQRWEREDRTTVSRQHVCFCLHCSLTPWDLLLVSPLIHTSLSLSLSLSLMLLSLVTADSIQLPCTIPPGWPMMLGSLPCCPRACWRRGRRSAQYPPPPLPPWASPRSVGSCNCNCISDMIAIYLSLLLHPSAPPSTKPSACIQPPRKARILPPRSLSFPLSTTTADDDTHRTALW